MLNKMASRRSAVAPMTVGEMDMAADKVVAQMRAAGIEKVKVEASPVVVDGNGLSETSTVEVKTTGGLKYETTTTDQLQGVNVNVVESGMTTTSSSYKTGNVIMITSLLYLIIALFVIWLVGVWPGSSTSWSAYANNYSWATAPVMGVFTSFALFLLFVATSTASYMGRTNTTCNTLCAASYVLYIFELLLFAIAAIVIFNTSTGHGADAAFWLTLVGGILALVQTVVVCFTIGRCNASWFPVIPMVLYLAWVVVALVVFYKMWRNN